MTRTMKAYFAENFPGMTVEESLQEILEELSILETENCVDTSKFRALVETLLDDLHASYGEDDYDD